MQFLILPGKALIFEQSANSDATRRSREIDWSWVAVRSLDSRVGAVLYMHVYEVDEDLIMYSRCRDSADNDRNQAQNLGGPIVINTEPRLGWAHFYYVFPFLRLARLADTYYADV